MALLEMQEIEVVGENDHGYRFCVGRIGDRWLGFATGSNAAAQMRQAFRDEGLDPDPGFMFILPQIAESHQLGVPDKRRAILLTGAIAEDPASAFGGVERWFIPEDLRGKPDDFRCAHCDEVGCEGKDCRDAYDYDPDEEGCP